MTQMAHPTGHTGDRYAAYTRTLLERALAHQREGRLADAERVYEQVLQRQPNHFDALHMLGVVALQTQRPDRAVKLITKALPQKPTAAAAHNHLAKAMTDLGRFEEAVASYDRAIALRPGFADAYIGRATSLRHLELLDEALASCDQAIALRPDVAGAYICRALILRSMLRAEEALASCDKAVATQPDLPDAWDKLGTALRDVNELEESLAVFQAAITHWPDFASARMNAGMSYLQLGHADPGWSLYDWRHKDGRVAGRTWDKPRWHRDEDIAGKTLLVWSEQGLGDTIQFCRYAPVLESRGAKVVLYVQSRLCALLKGLGSTIDVVPEGVAPPKFDLHCPLLSLPLACGTTLETIPSTVPYLAAEPERVLQWRRRIGSEGFKIGICWQGSKLPIDVGRSFPLSLFREISQVPGVRLISLQKGPGTEQLDTMPAGMRVETLGDAFDAGPNAFLDTAAVMESLDLVITSDTSIAHLAGALARLTWVALKQVPEWRWLLEREDSPWYRSHHLFRQKHRGEWQDVFNLMLARLLGTLERR